MVKPVKATVPRVLPTETPEAKPGDNQADRETFHYHLGIIVQMKAAVDAHRKHLKNARRAAQDAGIVLHDLDTILKMREEEPETVQDGIRRLAQYAHWAGLAPGVQGDLFKDGLAKVDEVAKAEDEGYVDGLEGNTASGDRYDASTPAGQARLRGWNRGQDVIRKRFIEKNGQQTIQ